MFRSERPVPASDHTAAIGERDASREIRRLQSVRDVMYNGQGYREAGVIVSFAT